MALIPRARWDALFGVDLRSLALLRVGLASTLLFDLAVRFGDLSAHYTDAGVLPRGPLLSRFSNPWTVSLHVLNGTTAVEAVLFTLAAAAALTLLVGWRTHVAAIVSWILLISLHGRNPVVLQGSDLLLRMLLFWSLFLPIDARYSVDSALNSSRDSVPVRLVTVASAALLLQVALMYFFSAWHKSGDDWRNGTAIAYALQIDHFAKPLGRQLAHAPWLWLLTYAVLAIEWLAPILLFLPKLRRARPVAIACLVALQAGLWMTMELGIFPWVSILALTPFLSTEWWERWMARLRTPDRQKLRIYYDRDCLFCRKSVHLLRTFLLLPETPVRAAQEDAAIERLMEQQRSWVVIDAHDRHHLRFDAMLAILRASPLAWWLTPLLAWRPLSTVGSSAYRWVADHRPLFGHVCRPLRYRPMRVVTRWPAQAVAGLALVYVIWWNLTGLPATGFTMPRALAWIGPMFQISQKWDMFAPVPMKSDGWYVIPGTLHDGEVVDLMRGGSRVSWDKPVLVSAMYPNQRWRKYLVNLHKKRYSGHRPLFARYICRRWNAEAEPGRQVQSLELVYMREDTPPQGQAPDARRIVLLEYTCD